MNAWGLLILAVGVVILVIVIRQGASGAGGLIQAVTGH